MKQETAQDRWEQLTQRPLLALAVVFAVAYAVPIVDDSAGHRLTSACTVVEWVVWGTFAADYLVRVGLARHRKEFVRTHWMDLCAVVLPILQPLRLLRMVSTNSRCSSSSGVSINKSVMPVMAFMGVRISWLMLARN